MKKLYPLLIFTLFILAAACSKTKDDSQKRKFVSMILDDGYALSENPAAMITYTDVSTDNPTGFPMLVLSGFTYQKNFFSFAITSLTSDLHPGTYVSGQSGNSFTMLDSLSNVSTADESQGSFSLTIATIKDSVIQGTFNAVLIDNGTGNLHIVKNGAFRTVYHNEQ